MWFQLKIEHCPVDELELLSEELEQSGALSIMLTDKNDNPVLEPAPGTTPLWPEVIIHALYAKNSQVLAIQEQLAKTKPYLQSSLEVLPDKDWERVWMDDFKPLCFGKNLWICPSWATPPKPEAVNLMLDPGLAFGSGTHPTTFLCLTWLDQAPLEGITLIDYGCGSGILSLAALKLGAKLAYAVDIDPQALEATQNNANSNFIAKLSLKISEPQELKEPVDLILANILLEPLMALKDRFHQLLKKEGLLVVSGILSEQAPILIKAYESSFTPITSEQHDGWSLLVFKGN